MKSTKPIEVDEDHQHWLHMRQGFKTTCHRPGAPYPRAIHFGSTEGEEIWSYRVTDEVLVIRNPEGTKTTKVSVRDFSHPDDPSIRPADVKKFIRTFLKD